MKNKKKTLSTTQIEIIKAVLKRKRPQTTYKISKTSGKAWATVKTNLQELEKKKAVKRKRRGNKNYWFIDYV